MSRSAFAIRVAVTLLVVGLAAEARAQARPKLDPIRPKVSCSSMVGHAIPAARIALPTRGATITTAQIKGPVGQAGAPDFLPEYCSMTGIISPVDPMAPPITFAVNIPTAWNQKAWHIGGQGFNGIIPVNVESVARAGQQGFRPGSPLNATYPPNAPQPLGQGYATFGGDSGHQNPPQPEQGGRGAPPDAAAQAAAQAWMWNEEAWMNLTHAALKKTHDAAQEVIKAMYGHDARLTYFGGQSHGGREALFVANMYPDDYEGVLAAGPLAEWATWTITSALRAQLQTTAGAWVPPSKAVAIRDETLRLCDSLDGLADAVIQNYYDCTRTLDPNVTPNPLANIRCPGGTDAGDHCLSDAQMATVNAWHGGGKFGYPLANGHDDWPGETIGGEAPQGWLLSQTQPNPATPIGFSQFLRGGIRDKAYQTVDLTRDRAKIQAMSKLMDARADWSKLLGRGSKLIYYTPGSDYLISARLQQRVYQDALKKSGQAAFERGVRYYVAPGLGHGGGGRDAKGEPLPQFVDLVSALENWVENGTAPETLEQTLMGPSVPYTVTRARPLCRYPQYPHYSGSGDPAVAASYACRGPSGASATH